MNRNQVGSLILGTAATNTIKLTHLRRVAAINLTFFCFVQPNIEPLSRGSLDTVIERAIGLFVCLFIITQQYSISSFDK